MPGRLAEKVVLMSGGGGTKGQELAALLVADGARVVVSDIDEDRAAAVASAVGDPQRIRSLRLDVGDESHWEHAVGFVRETFGQLDALVNSARLISRSLVADLSLDDWHASSRVNLDGPFLGAKHCLPMLVEAGGGSIVNIVSLSAVQPNDTTPAYAACNAAVLNLCHTIALQYAPANVRANSVLVGFSANSPMDDTHELARRVVPLGRPNSGADIAQAVLWLVSDHAAYVTGTELRVDGGRSAGLKLTSG
jgi:3alpha(or 20beta)-hydroxysteroid dehydrogenase